MAWGKNATLEQYNKIKNDIAKRNFRPVYFFHGEENFYIDKLTELLEKTVLTESEKSFNQFVFYGLEVDVKRIVNECKRFPMMSEFQLIIVKEAQNLEFEEEEEAEALLKYLENPASSTILVFAHKNSSFDKRLKLFKAFEKFVTLDSKSLYDNEVPQWISVYAKEQKLNITEKATQILAEFTGSDLSRIVAEIDKMLVDLGDKKEITEHEVATQVGLTHEYTAFDLQKKIARKNMDASLSILKQMTRGKNRGAMIMIIATLYPFFAKVHAAQFLTDKSNKNLQAALKLNYFQTEDIAAAVRNFNKQKTENIIAALLEYDMKLKGVDDNQTPDFELGKELLFKIIY